MTATIDLYCRYCRRQCSVQAELDRGAAILHAAGLGYRGAICPLCASRLTHTVTLSTMPTGTMLGKPRSIVLTRCGTGFCVDLLDGAKRMVYYSWHPSREQAKEAASKLALAIAAGEKPWLKKCI